MASTRSSSPINGTSTPTSPQLSPQSKIKALLAAVDDADSDDEPSLPIKPKTLFKSTDKNAIANTESPAVQSTENSDDDEEEEIVRPRGRLAARMRTKDTNTANDMPSNITNCTARSLTESTQSNAPLANSDEDDDEDVSALPRRRLTRPDREATPEAGVNAETPSSPGLFVTPAPETPIALHQPAAESDTDDELPRISGKNERFQALVARKRQERLAKEEEEERKRKERVERMAEQMPAESEVDDDVSDITDDEGGRRLTQKGSRPARKASKKALEEMNRETQRMSRSLQLAHEAKTKKKISKASLFERFNFRTESAPADNKPMSSSRPTTPGSVQHTDVDMADGTPPSSPPLAIKSIQDPPTPKAAETSAKLDDVFGDDDVELPSLEDVLAQSKTEDKGKGKAIETVVGTTEAKKNEPSKPRRQVRVKLPPIQANLVTIDSDDELEITKPKKGRMDAIFDRLPEKKAQEPRSMNVLRRLAHLSSPTRESSRGRNAKPSMTSAELGLTLMQRAKAQSKLERERRLEFLRSKGITVQTEEERQREREEIDDIVARERQKIEEAMQREREEAKKARKEKKQNGEDDPLAWDDSDDDSYEESEQEDPVEIELSGSEEEKEGEEEDELDDAENGDEEEPAPNPMFEDEAEEDGESDEERTPKAARHVASGDEEDDELPAVKSRRPKKHVHIVSDDEDDEVQATPRPKANPPKSPSVAHTSSPKIPTSVLRSATKPFIPGLPIPAAAPAGLGLTQIFAGTMDDSQIGPANRSPLQFAPSLDDFPDSQFSATAGQSQNDLVLNSQNTQNIDTQAQETQGVQLHFLQSQAHGFDSLMQIDGTQMSQLIEPTQDGGFQDFSPLKQRFVDAPQSTVDTVLMGGTPDNETILESPLAKRRGKLRRRGENPVSLSTLASTDAPGSPSAAPKDGEIDTKAAASAFKLMEKAAKRKRRMQEKFDKKKSKATEMIEEQAEESEDEYAGLGGADGEDSSEEDEELVKEMIDDTTGNDADDAKLAGFFADRERAADAAQVDKLFRDITTGMLRKRRRGGNNDFDLSDSDDGGEARRRLKRRQFAKMQKALFADERIGKIAENPRNAAFLKSIEDRNSDDEWDFGDNFADAAPGSADSESQSQGQDASAAEESIPNSQPTNEGRKRAHADEHAARPPPNARRTKGGVRPTSLTDVRRELSNLLDEPNGSAASIIPATEIGSDSEDEERPRTSSSNKENRRPEVAVVDRIKLKRDSSSLSTTNNGAASSGSSSRLAFAAPSASGGSGLFKVPALLRRATTNSLISNSSSSSGSSTPTTSLHKVGDDSKVLKKTAGKRSGVNYFARENERRAAVADAEKRREAKKWKGVEGRSKVVGGLFGGGQF
ncbi:hypothetical protein K449DRAFT_380453, partial [Hypoxylon sp. EC38]